MHSAIWLVAVSEQADSETNRDGGVRYRDKTRRCQRAGRVIEESTSKSSSLAGWLPLDKRWSRQGELEEIGMAKAEEKGKGKEAKEKPRGGSQVPRRWKRRGSFRRRQSEPQAEETSRKKL